MVHAIEAYASRNANNNPLSRMLAREALRLLGANIERAVADGGDRRGARRDAARLDAGRTGLRQCARRGRARARLPDRRHFHVPHGLSNALVLPHVLRFNAPAARADYAAIAADAFPQLAAVEGRQGPRRRLHRGFGRAFATRRLAPRLRDVGIPEAALGRMAADAMLQTRLLVNNPREVAEADALAIYRAAW